MDARDIGRVLTKAAAFDQRTVGDADILAWLDAIGDLDLEDALAAVTRHYRDTDQRIMPVHVRRIVEQIGRERQRTIREACEQRALEAYRAEAGPLTDRSAEIQEFVGRVRDVLPESDREVLRPRAVAWEREHRAYQRQATAEPNLSYDPSMAPLREWNRDKCEPVGCWWEDAAARERHAKVLLAEAGRLAGRKPAHEEAS